MSAEPGRTHDFRWTWIPRAVALAFRSVPRHKALFALVSAGVVALALAAVDVMPRTYEVRSRLVVRPSRSVASRFDEWRDAPARTAARLLRGEERLRGLARATNLAAEWRERRPAVLRLKDRLLGGDPDSVDEDDMTELLGNRLSVSFSQDGSVEIAVRWPDPAAAYRLATAAQEQFVETWHALEVASISDLIALLERHAAAAKGNLDRRLEELRRLRGGLAPALFGAGRAASELEGSRGDDEADTLRAIEARRRAVADLLQLDGRGERAAEPGPRRAPEPGIDSETRLHLELLRFGPPLRSGEPERVAPAERPEAAAPAAGARGAASLMTEEILIGDVAWDPASPLAESARAELVQAARAYAALLDRIGAARLELETSAASFDERYIVVLPPEVPRGPIRPTIPLVALAALLDGVLLGLLACALVERRRLVRVADESAAGAPVSLRDRFSALLPVAGLAGACLMAVLAGNGHLGISLAPLVLAIVIFAGWRLPLRDTMPALAFLCLTLENPSEGFAEGQWRSPLFTVGALFLSHMNVTVPVKALFFSGLDLALVLLVVAWVFRQATGRETAGGIVPAASPMRNAALACLAIIAVVWMFGLARGGHFGNSLWQIFRLVYLPCVLLLFLAALRAASDAGRLGTVLLVAALLRASVAIYVRQLFPDVEKVAFATIHADSMLFADACLLVVVLFFEHPSRKALVLAAATLPILGWGMVANNRRLVWVELGLGLLTVAVLTRWTPLKRGVVRAMVLALPLALVYVGAGWSRPTGVFGPVRVLKSVVDSKSDSSTAWRDLENYNIIQTIQHHPVLGTGFGHEYEEVVRLPSISNAYALYRYAPHNSVLGLVAFAGILGFCAIWMILALGVFFAVRSYRFAIHPRDRVAALTSVGVLVCYMVHCFGDMGLGTWASVFTVAPALALVAKLAVTTGAWPARPRRGAATPAGAA